MRRVRGSDDDDAFVYFGQGSVCDLREADEPAPRLAGLKSVSRAAAWAMRSRPEERREPVGFHIPKRP